MIQKHVHSLPGLGVSCKSNSLGVSGILVFNNNKDDGDDDDDDDNEDDGGAVSVA